MNREQLGERPEDGARNSLPSNGAHRDQVEYRGPLKDPTKRPMEEAVRPPPEPERAAQLFDRIRVEQGQDAFLEDIRQHAAEILGHVASFQRRPGKSRDEVALGIYLDAILKEVVLGVDPFAPRFSGDEDHQADREAIAFAATEHVAHSWLAEQPASRAAQHVRDLGLFASPATHQALLRELWPTLPNRLDSEI